MEDKKEKEESAIDFRYEYIFGHLHRSLRIKRDRWNRMLAQDDYKDVVDEWANNASKRILVVCYQGGGVLVPRLGFPTTGKGKSCYFVRQEPVNLTEDNIRKIVLCGDISPNPVEDLSILVDELFYPLLNNPLNQKGWPSVIVMDVENQIQELRNIVAEIKGNMNNQTLLPLPITIDRVMEVGPSILEGNLHLCDLNLKNSLEGIVIKWGIQIGEVLTVDSKTFLANTQFPLPSNEVNFWSYRFSNLRNIYKQIITPQVKMIASILEKIDSVYFIAFKNTFKSVVASLHESRDIYIWISGLTRQFEVFEQNEFHTTKKFVDPLLHCICLLWTHSPYYASNQQIISLFQMIGNLLIKESIKDLDPSSIFQGDIEENLLKLTQNVEVLEYYKQQVAIYRSNLKDYPIEPQKRELVEWTFQFTDIFNRLDLYITRVKKTIGIFQTASDFTKLDRIIIGNLRGKMFSSAVQQRMEDFQKLFYKWSLINFDPLDIDPLLTNFEKELALFREESDAMEMNLGQIFIETIEDCSNVDQLIKLVAVGGTILHREIVSNLVGDRFMKIVECYKKELNLVNFNFEKMLMLHENFGMACLERDPGMPVVVGALMQLQRFVGRVNNPLEDLPYLDFPTFDSEDGQYVLEMKDELIGGILELEKSILNKWATRAPERISNVLDIPLLVREGNLLKLNYLPDLSSLLMEIKYLKTMGYEVPGECEALYERSDELFVNQLKMLRIVEWYNYNMTKTEKCEFHLIEAQIEQLDGDIEIALTDTWNTYSQDFVIELYENTQNLYQHVRKAQENLKLLLQSIHEWGDVPYYVRKDFNSNALLHIAGRNTQVQQRVANILASRDLLLYVMDDNYRLFFNLPTKQNQSESRSEINSQISNTNMQMTLPSSSHPSEDDEESYTGTVEESESGSILVSATNLTSLDYEFVELYAEYRHYVDELVGAALIKAIAISVAYIKNEMENSNMNNSPVFEVRFELHGKHMGFVPSFNSRSITNTFVNLVETLLMDIYNMAEIIPRVCDEVGPGSRDKKKRRTYTEMLESNNDIEEMRLAIFSMVRKTIKAAIEYTNIYDKYIHIWLDNKAEKLGLFLRFGRIPTDEEVASLKTDNPIIKEVEPKITDFKNEINKWNELYDEVSKLPTKHSFNIWLSIDSTPFKHAVLNEICKWSNTYKQYLYNHVIESLNELDTFISDSNKILATEFDQDDLKALLLVMAFLNQLKDRQYETDMMFEPLKDIIDLLKQYNISFSEVVQNQFIELPSSWNKLKKFAVQVKQKIQPIQAYHMDLINKRINLFDIRMSLYREKFKQNEMFKYPCDDVYQQIDTTDRELVEIELDILRLNDISTVFDLIPPDVSKLVSCRNDLKSVKQLWDFVHIVESQVDDWKKSRWVELDVEIIELDIKNLSKDQRALNKSSRAWEPYSHIDNVLKNLSTSLRAINELQNPAIRSRHWALLTAATGVDVKVSLDTTLEDLMNFNLHEYEEDVNGIVDKAVKEMAIEKVLRDINTNWKDTEFDYEYHSRTGLKLLKVREELIETLEENQVQLHNLLGLKDINFFEKDVNDWVLVLQTADKVIELWMDVQRKWVYLEAIFVGSEDIRKQIPTDSERFDNLSVEFKNMLPRITSTPHVIRATNQDGLLPIIQHTYDDLLLCEKALNQYLETKRLVNPRFYFISSADLLDILSNGNNAPYVGKHLPKLYDSILSMKFDQSGKIAVGMYSKENDEYVQFNLQCNCTGKVEDWLNRVTDTMKNTLHQIFEEAIKDYDMKSRDSWVFNWPAQPALCTTQIMWSRDVGMAFDKLSEGYENAIRDYNRRQVQMLNALISLLLTDLSAGDRQKIMTICTIDVHSRDVVTKMIATKVQSDSEFQWQCQLRHRWDRYLRDCYANICDAQFKYDYEYLGNTPRLVITPLTDRCYITLTQSLHLIMGGAPAGPAGTGKTETTKDLGKGLGIMVYVFNCSEQMDYRSCGNIYKGLSQTGAWGCFDEFNRISIEVLSVVAVQVKCIQDAIKAKRKIFNFLGDIITLVPTVGLFITMNPGYAGRTELPENLKALFRPCAMVVPDFALICEIMLVAEGFQEARLLARKFITLYTLCKELLTKQDHYDWGLRAIKSVLVVAGALRREDKQRPEEQVLMRALRDFNIPKIITDDLPVFMGLIGDLFPLIDVPRKRNMEFEKTVKKASLDMHLQPEEGFLSKVVQLDELFAVRHSVFIVGNAGTGKTQVWKTLHKSYELEDKKPIYNDINPKAVTNDELFGIINSATREWRDGLISMIMREHANLKGNGPTWLVLDGDIDPMWIESLNTVMDDNKVLTLASNERVALTKEMRLLFEIGHLRTATPATVSRAGILYINPADLGWYPMVASWLETRKDPIEKSNLLLLFDRYLPVLMEVSKKFKRITPVSDIAVLHMTCHLLDCFLTSTNVPRDCPKEWYELYFVFAIIWGFGSGLFEDQLIDWRKEFSKFWTSEFKNIKFPLNDSIFNYFIDDETKKFKKWEELVPHYTVDPDIPLQACLIPTADTVRLSYFLNLLIKQNHPIMLVGNAGSGKTVIVNNILSKLNGNYIVSNIPLNFYTTSAMLQTILEKPLEKKAGRNYGAPGTKKIIYFVDDLNMPEVDAYGTVQPHQIMRQFMDYRHWYDRSKLQMRVIHNCQFATCMNPTSGSFTIDPRLQRHFCCFAVNFPDEESLFRIYDTIFIQHLSAAANKFHAGYIQISSQIIRLVLMVHQRVTQQFLPTAIKFHYIFNLRDLANIFQAFMFANIESCPEPPDLIRLCIHEIFRVYGDKLVDLEDRDSFNKLVNDALRKNIEDIDESRIYKEPLIYCHFADGFGERETKYKPVISWESLSDVLNAAQTAYNEDVGYSNLVLFHDALSHVCRINRITEGPRGNALLIGVGGSGKQSLARMSAFISGFSVEQIQLRRGYGLNDLRDDLGNLYMKVGVKNMPSMFLMTDNQVAEESYLVLINDMLASGEVSDLFTDEQVDSIVNAVRNETRQAGMGDSETNCWKFFIQKVRRTLKIVLCFSPVGSTLRVRGRKFPAIVNCTAIDWFHEWPNSALESVSYRFLQKIEFLPIELTKSISQFMAYTHQTVNEMSGIYLLNEKRYNYTTPKTFLELISLYTKLLNTKTKRNTERISQLENGLIKLAKCSEQVDGLQEQLAEKELIVRDKNDAADKLIKVVGAENEKVQKEREFVAEEEAKVRIIEAEVSVKAKLCESDLKNAEPALIAAQEALNTLNKNNLTELKSFGSPPKAVERVCAAVLVLFSPRGKVITDRSWRAAKVLMNNTSGFLKSLIEFDKENIPKKVIKALMPYLNDKDFNPDKVGEVSAAAAGLCAWVINIYKFYEVYLVVGPKQKALKEAQVQLKSAQDKLAFLNCKIDELEYQLASIQEEFDNALEEKQRCQADADKTALTIDLAQRLVRGLGTESIRWRQTIKSLQTNIITIPGDVLLISCFISYVGCFTRYYRVDLLEKKWIPTLKEMVPPIPYTEDTDPLLLICDDAQIATWNNEGLPSDRMSTENAAILVNSTRWPLIIDPQLQGLKWIKQKYGHRLIVLRPTMKNYIEVMEKSVKRGDVVLLENIGDNLDAVLDPLLSRALIKKGKAIKIGDREIDYNPKFRLILQTKLANPHYRPEIQAQTTLINFTVTKDGLEEQLLAEVVKAERPDLEQLKADLTMQQNSFKISLKELEDDLLERLNSAGPNVLDDPVLVYNLEKTKKTSEEIEIKVQDAKFTAVRIDEAREQYRSAGERASIIYFVLNDLFHVNPIYQFSLKSFITVFKRAIYNTPSFEQIDERVRKLLDNITYTVYMYTCRSLFEKDKIIFMAQLVIQIELQSQDIDPVELDFLLRFPFEISHISPLEFLNNNLWGGIKALCRLFAFRGLDNDIETSAKRWKNFVDSSTPENEKLPGEWKSKTPFQRLCIMRCLRPDRMIYAIRNFVGEIMGQKYIQGRVIPFRSSFKESSCTIPILFILSPGVDPLIDVERLGKVMRYSTELGNFHNISLGQGQEIIAEDAIDLAADSGHWVILQNIHLVAKWLSALEKKMEETQEYAHENYRLFLSAEPAASPEFHIIPQGILESAIKITNEPPTGMMANLHQALDNFSQETLEMCTKESEFKAILFGLCYFHAVVCERRKFGAQGWNRRYPFNVGDLTISVYVLYNYLEANMNIPWEDLRYLFGEIMYGGHITDDWDRRLCRTYLEEYMKPDLVDGDLSYCPGFPAPPNTDFDGYHQYVNEILPSESPVLYGMHPNAEIGFLTSLTDEVFKTIFDLQPRGAGTTGSGTATKDDLIRSLVEDYQDRLPEIFNQEEIQARIEEITPFITVASQECERINKLIMEMKRSLGELNLGLRGELTITSSMEILGECLLYDKVPEDWTALAYPSLLGLQAWYVDLMVRHRELESWIIDFSLPSTVWLAGFFNPQTFLTAIMQTIARKNEWPLDKMCLSVEVTTKSKEDITAPPREGAFINGLYMEGARWDNTINSLNTSILNELFPIMPVIYIKAITQDKQETRNIYECPVYRTRMRGPTYVWTFNLKSKDNPAKWILGGVALLLQI